MRDNMNMSHVVLEKFWVESKFYVYSK